MPNRRPSAPTQPGRTSPKRAPRQAEPHAGVGGDTVPNPAVAVLPKFARRVKWFRRAILFTIVMAPLMAIAYFSSLAKTPPAPAAEGRGYAAYVLDQWIAGGEAFGLPAGTPIPGGRVIGYRDATVTIVQDRKVTGRVETHRFDVVTAAGPMIATVEVRLGSAGWEPVKPAPSLEPLLGTNAATISAVWPGYGYAPIPAPAEEMVRRWASAYFAGDSVELFRMTGDTDGSHVYVGVPGLGTVVRVSSTDAAMSSIGGLIIRTDIIMSPDADPDGPTWTQSMDVLVMDQNLPVPRIVAWGGPGTGPRLRPTANAAITSGAAAVATPPELPTIPPVVTITVTDAPASTPAATPTPAPAAPSTVPPTLPAAPPEPATTVVTP